MSQLELAHGRAQQRRGASRCCGPSPFWRSAAAELAIFDPALLPDHASFAQPHQYATGMAHVFVNGAQVQREGRPAQFS
jgi:hypothetical protein